MKIIINTESLTPPLTGIGNYTLNLLSRLLDLQEIKVLECFSGQSFMPPEKAIANCMLPMEPLSAPDWSRSYRLRSILRKVPLAYRTRAFLHDYKLRQNTKRRADYIYHEPNFILKNHQGPCITTVHDLSFIHYPEHHPVERVNWIGGQLPKTLERADHIITPSEIIRQELIQEMGVSPDRVRSIHLGANDCFRPMSAAETSSTLRRHNLSHGGYILFVASLEPRKGVDTLLDAWCNLPVKTRQDWPLVLAGAPGWKNQILQKRIDKLKTTTSLRHLQYVPYEELPMLYAGAGIFAYPSMYEGFGLPVLEAMSCAVPVITTKDTSMAEFAAVGATLVPHSDPQALSSALLALLENPSLRNDMAMIGLEQSRLYSWERCAQETMQVYRMALEQH